MQVEKEKLRAKFLVSSLSRAALIPTYSFPVHSCRLEVIQNKGTTSFIGAPQNDGLQLDRDATLAISEYAPGAEVVAGGRIWVSAGIVRYPKDFMPLQHYLVCRICRHVQISMNHDDIEPLCPQCHSMNYERRSFIEPKGFLTAYQDAEGRDPASSRIRQRPVEEARLITRVATDRYQMTDVRHVTSFFAPATPLDGDTAPKGRLFVVNKAGICAVQNANTRNQHRCKRSMGNLFTANIAIRAVGNVAQSPIFVSHLTWDMCLRRTFGPLPSVFHIRLLLTIRTVRTHTGSPELCEVGQAGSR